MTKPVSRGDRFQPSARQLNHWNQATSPATNLTHRGRAPAQHDNPNSMLIKNLAGKPLPEFSVLKIGDSLITMTQEWSYKFGPRCHQGLPVEDVEDLRICVLQSRAAVGDQLVPAMAFGMTFVRLTGALGKTAAKLVGNQQVMEADDDGSFPILYDPGPSGVERVARILIGSGGGTAQKFLKLDLYGNPSGGSFVFALQYYADLEAVPLTSVLAQATINVPATLKEINEALDAAFPPGILRAHAFGILDGDDTIDVLPSMRVYFSVENGATWQQFSPRPMNEGFAGSLIGGYHTPYFRIS